MGKEKTENQRRKEVRRMKMSEMKKNHPEAFGQFLFGITMAILSFLQIVAVVLFCVFH